MRQSIYKIESKYVHGTWYDWGKDINTIKEARKLVRDSKLSYLPEDRKDFEWRIIKYKGEIIK